LFSLKIKSGFYQKICFRGNLLNILFLFTVIVMHYFSERRIFLIDNERRQLFVVNDNISICELIIKYKMQLLLVPYRFLGAPYEITKIPFVCDLSHRHPLKYPTRFYFYKVRYLNLRWHFSKFITFPTFVT
jgi:hypothetical protein